MRVSRDLWPWPWPWAHPRCRLSWWPSCASLVAIGPFAWEKKRFSCQHKSARITWPLTLTLSTRWMQAYLESIMRKFGSDPTICVGEEAICAKVYRQTDRRRTPRHCISSFLEWAKNWFPLVSIQNIMHIFNSNHKIIVIATGQKMTT